MSTSFVEFFNKLSDESARSDFAMNNGSFNAFDVLRSLRLLVK